MMNKYVFAALSIAVAIGPAQALDVGLGGKAGGIGAGADVGVGREGASLDGGASADGVGGANLGGSVGTGNGAPSASVGAGGNVDGVGGANLGGSVGTDNGAPSASDGGSSGGSAGGSSVGSSSGLSAGSGPSAGSSTGRGAGSGNGTNSSGASAGIGQSQRGRNTIVALPGALIPHARIVLPRSLGPSNRSSSALARSTWGYPLLPKMAQKPGTSDAVVRVCQQAIFSAARPLGAVGVQAASAGPVRRQPNGLTAPLSVRIDYGKEVRQAQISCRLDAKGRVITVT